MLALNNDAASVSPLEHPKKREPILLTPPGCCVQHFITASAWAVFGTLGLLFERSHPTEAARGIPFAMALTYHGYMMLLHQQANFTASLLHKTHGGETHAGFLPIFDPTCREF